MSWWEKLANKRRGVSGSNPPLPQPQGSCDHGAIHLRQGTAEYEWFVSRLLLLRGDAVPELA